ncbi:MAG: hypothetical protein V3V20_08700 [Algisphaera sp.]
MNRLDLLQFKSLVMAGSLGLACSLTGAAYAQAADGDDAVGLFDENQNMEGQDVQQDALGQIDITVKDLEIAKVLQLLSIQSQRNIVASRNVSGTVSADLYGVSFYEALEAILTPNGYGYEEQGNFIYVYTSAELKERELANRTTVTKIVRLNYISGEDAKKMIEATLSENGSIVNTESPSSGFLPSSTDAGSNGDASPEMLLIKDYEENVAQAVQLLEELDVRPQQVLVEATILSARLTENNAFGIDFAVFANLDGLNIGNPLNAVGQLLNPQGDGGTAASSTVGNTQTGGAGFKIGVSGSEGSAFLRALDAVTDTTVLAKPNILVLNRQSADILVGERLGYLSTTVTDTSETQTIEFLDVGTQLTVRPFISNEGTIRLELRPSVSDGTVTIQDGFVIPNETTSEMVTNILVESGQTVVLGGLFKEDTTIDRDQIPGLGNLPFLGAAFRGQDDTVERSEVIFMVKTTILEHADLAVRGDAADEQVENERIAARNGLLPFSNDKLVSAHLLESRRQLAQGDTKKALWSVNLALHLAPTSSDAIALKEEIQGHEIRYEDRYQFNNLGDGVIGSELGTQDETVPAYEILN